MESFVRLWIVGIIAALSCAVETCAPARADFPWMFAQVTCAPTLGYFSIRRIMVLDLPNKGPYLTEGLEPGPEISEVLAREKGIFDSDLLEREPIACSVPAFKSPNGWGAERRTGFDVKVIGHLDRNSEKSSYCEIADNAEIFLNGKSIGFIVLNPCKTGELTISIEIAQDGDRPIARKCVEPAIGDDPDGNKLVCIESPVGDGH